MMKLSTIVSLLLVPGTSYSFSQRHFADKRFPNKDFNLAAKLPSRILAHPANLRAIAFSLMLIGGGMCSAFSDPAWAVDDGITNSPAFRLLPREQTRNFPSAPPPATPTQRANEQLRQLTNLQDETLAKCIDRGEYWEQCFYNGMRNDEKGIDFQWGSPEAALEPLPTTTGTTLLKRSLKTSTTNADTNGNGKFRPPTW